MSYVRSDGYRLTNPEDDAAFQVVVGDLQRLALNLSKGSDSSAYMTQDGVESSGFLEADNNLSDVTSTTESLFNIYGLTGEFSFRASYTSGSGTHIYASASKYVLVYCFAAGGGGGRGDSVLVSAGGQGGGSGGSFLLIKRILSATAAYSVGAGGAAATGAGLQGGNGGDSTFDIYTCGGGEGGSGMVTGYSGDAGEGIKTVNGSSTTHGVTAGALLIPFNGAVGLPGVIGGLSLNGSGEVYAATAILGVGGRSVLSPPYPAAGYGNYGGDGGSAYSGINASAGSAGLIYVYEA